MTNLPSEVSSLAARYAKLIVLCVALSSLTAAPSPAAEAQRLPGLSGYWRLKDKGNAIPALTPWARAEMAKPDRRGDVELASDLWCIFQGMPYVMDNAGVIEIRQSPGETVILGERLAVPRHVYFKLAERPSPDVFDFTAVGFSTGELVGDSLVVTTDMFTDGVGLDGAPRTEQAKVVERFKVSKDGNQLTIASTWTDPSVYTTPFDYTWTYERVPEDYVVQFFHCDPQANGVGNYPPGEDPRSRSPGN